MLFGLEEQLEKNTKREKEQEQSSYLYTLYQDNEFLDTFENYMISFLPPTITRENIIPVFGRQIKNMYKKLVQEKKWPEKKFTIVLWNVAEKKLKPFDIQSYLSLEEEYNTCELNLPYDWKWIDEDIKATIGYGGDDFWT